MKKVFCDVPNCGKEAIEKDLRTCTGYHTSRVTGSKYEPFEAPIIRTMDLCEVHFTAWCKSTYQILFGDNNG